jgi:hypothetical protein
VGVVSIFVCRRGLWRLGRTPERLGTHQVARVRCGDAENHILFVTEASQVRAAPAGARRACPICAKQLTGAGHALLHASYHIVYTPSSEMCPLCFGLVSNCPPFLIKTNTLQPSRART